MRPLSDADLPFGGLGGPPATGGVVHIVGGGPGDPGCLTLRAATVLSTCDLIAHDHLSPAEALSLVPAHADRILVGRRSGAPGYSREEVDDLLFARAAAGQAVVRFKGGDPFVFGRGGEEASACAAAGVPFEIVSGVSSSIAVPAAAGIPVTHRTVSPGFMVATGHEASDDARLVDHASLARFPGTAVVLMGRSRLRELAASFITHGRDPDTPAAVISSGTLSTQRSVLATLATIADAADDADLRPPAVIVVGDVAAMREQLAWREHRTLHGVRVLLPRISDRASRLAAQLRHAGAAVLEVPVAHEVDGDPAALARLAVDVREGRIGTLVTFDADAVWRLTKALTHVDADVRALARTQLWAVGAHTGERLRVNFGLSPDAESASPTALLETTRPMVGPVVVLAADGSDGGLAAHLGARSVVTTRMVPIEAAAWPDVDAVVVPASRLAPLLVDALAGGDTATVAMGPITTAALREAGCKVDAQASEPTGPAVIAAIAAALPDRPRTAARHATAR